MGVTIREVAQMAKVSPATVSRYFSGSAIVGDGMSRQIEQAAQALGYTPSHTSRKRAAGVIVVLLPHFQQGYFNEVLQEIIQQMPKYRSRLVILPILPGDDSYKSVMKDLDVQGVLYLDEDIDRDILRYIRAKNVQVILFGGCTDESWCDYVHINDRTAAHEGMRYLLGLHHREILILGDYPYHMSSGKLRLEGCQQALYEYGLPWQEDKLVSFCELSYQGGYRAMQQALAEEKHFTAVFAFSDEVAMGAISALAEKGLRVPDDISVLGFDGITLSTQMVPKLTTIYQPIDKMVAWSLDMLVHGTHHKKEGSMEYTLPYQLLVRDSVKPREEKA